MKYGIKCGLISFTLFFVGIANVLATDFTVHEWGTFTSIQDPDGQVVRGVYHEDEPLPDFVYGRDQFSSSRNTPEHFLASCNGGPGGCKRVEPMPKGTLLAVNEKLETPVLYFYSKEPFTATVDVSFPNGIISQWFPNSINFDPPVDKIRDFTQGSMSWKVDILTDSNHSLPRVSPESIWGPSRNVRSNLIRAGNEIEKFIFYRGLGKFTLPVTTGSNKNRLILTNESKETIPSVFILECKGGSGSFISMGRILPGQKRAVSLKNIEGKRQTLPVFLNQISKEVETSLLESGLYPDEAHAMVRTWANSYFKTKGTRVLYVLPRKWTDDLLPIHIHPAPSQLVRTLVGRIELLTTQEQEAILDRGKSNGGVAELAKELGRFAEPKINHVIESRQNTVNRGSSNGADKEVSQDPAWSQTPKQVLE